MTFHGEGRSYKSTSGPPRPVVGRSGTGIEGDEPYDPPAPVLSMSLSAPPDLSGSCIVDAAEPCSASTSSSLSVVQRPLRRSRAHTLESRSFTAHRARRRRRVGHVEPGPRRTRPGGYRGGASLIDAVAPSATTPEIPLLAAPVSRTTEYTPVGCVAVAGEKTPFNSVASVRFPAGHLLQEQTARSSSSTQIRYPRRPIDGLLLARADHQPRLVERNW